MVNSCPMLVGDLSPADSLRMSSHRLFLNSTWYWANRLVPRGDPEVFWLLGRPGPKEEVDDMWAGLRAAKAPALVLRATKSCVLDAVLAARMVEALPDGRYRELELGHFMHCEDPVLIARTLNEFHASLEG